MASSFDISEPILPTFCLCGTSKNEYSSDPCTEDDKEEIL
jgi:hypothetical protein